jgi:hypothetical protein
MHVVACNARLAVRGSEFLLLVELLRSKRTRYMVVVTVAFLLGMLRIIISVGRIGLG